MVHESSFVDSLVDPFVDSGLLSNDAEELIHPDQEDTNLYNYDQNTVPEGYLVVHCSSYQDHMIFTKDGKIIQITEEDYPSEFYYVNRSLKQDSPFFISYLK